MSRTQSTVPEKSQPSVAVVIATYNRCDTVMRCLELLQQQTRVPDKVYVADNGSRDGTAENLRQRFGSNPMVELIELPENLGNAGGVRAGLEKAVATGFEAIWILDDDAWPNLDALEKLLARFSTDTVVSSLVVDSETGDLSWAYVLKSPRKVVDRLSGLPHSDVFEIRGAWLGALIPRKIVEQVGLPDANLFIRGEDEEYPCRIAKVGYRFFCVRDSILNHPTPHDVRRFQFFGRNLFYEPGLPPWKAYYIVRNRAYIHRKFADTAIEGFVKAWASVFFFLIMAVFNDNQKLRRLATYWKAGWRGYFGRLGIESRPT